MSKTPPAEVSLTTRFWMRVGAIDPRSDACMDWAGHRLPSGYGMLHGPDGAHLYAHRVSWMLIHGEIPPGGQILHTCDRPQCVRPSHLLLGDDSLNNQHKRERNRTRVIDPPCDHEVAAIRHLLASGRWSTGDCAKLILGDGAAQPMVSRLATGTTRKSAPGPTGYRGRGTHPDRRPHLEEC